MTLEPGPDLAGARVLVIDDGPTLTHGGLSFGAGMVAARAAGALPVDPSAPPRWERFAQAFVDFPHLDLALPALGYSDQQLADLAATIRATGATPSSPAPPSTWGGSSPSTSRSCGRPTSCGRSAPRPWLTSWLRTSRTGVPGAADPRVRAPAARGPRPEVGGP